MGEKKDTYSEKSSWFSRRRFLVGLGGVAAYGAGKTALDAHIHEGIRFFDPSKQCVFAHRPAIKAAAQDELDVHLVNLESEHDDNDYEVYAERKKIDKGLKGLGVDADVCAYNIDVPDEVYDTISETKVKAARRSGLINTIETYVDEETGVIDVVEEDDILVYIGDFESGDFEYRGTAYASNACGISNIYNDTYTTNQVLHNIGHTLGLPHTLSEDQMTWSLIKETMGHEIVFGFGQESQYNWRKSMKYYRDHKQC